MRTDVEYFKTKMDKIGGADDLGDHLLGLVDAKSVAPDPAAQESKQTPPSSDKASPVSESPTTESGEKEAASPSDP